MTERQLTTASESADPKALLELPPTEYWRHVEILSPNARPGLLREVVAADGMQPTEEELQQRIKQREALLQDLEQRAQEIEEELNRAFPHAEAQQIADIPNQRIFVKIMELPRAHAALPHNIADLMWVAS